MVKKLKETKTPKRTGGFFMNTSKEFKKQLQDLLITLNFHRRSHMTQADLIHELVENAYNEHIGDRK